jgi:hypothetical protein
MVVGQWYELNGDVYIYVNEQGTLEKHSRVKWYKVIGNFQENLVRLRRG